MNVAVLTGPEDERFVEPILKAISQCGIRAYALKIRENWVNLKPDALLGHFERATHTLVVCSATSLASSWFPFTVGFAYGKRLRIALYRVDPAHALKPFLSLLPILESLPELAAYYHLEKDEWVHIEERSHARAELLELGISFTVEALAKCVADGDFHALKLFFRAGLKVDTRNSYGVPLLSIAVRQKHQAVAEFLLESGALIDAKGDDRGYTALMDAVSQGSIDLVRLLLDRGAATNEISKDGQSALVIAVGRHDVETARLLLERGADPDVADKLGFSARKYAALFHNPAMMVLFQI